MGYVAITAGHGGSDPGAVNGKRTEASIACEMRNMVKLYLERAGLTVKTDGLLTVNLPLNDAINLAKDADLALEFHCNASANKSAKGTEALSDPKHKAVCQAVCGAISRVMEIPLRGEKGWKAENSGQHSRLGFISKGKGIIVELFFITNDSELAKWDEVKWLVAREVAYELIKILGGK